jgi:hypothetical protein
MAGPATAKTSIAAPQHREHFLHNYHPSALLC